MRAWLDSEFDKKPQIKKPRVGRGMLATVEDDDVFKKPEVGVFRRKIHPKYVTVPEQRPDRPDQEVFKEKCGASGKPEEVILSISKKRKREEVTDETVDDLPRKRIRTGRWNWVARWLPKWVSGIFGFSE